AAGEDGQNANTRADGGAPGSSSCGGLRGGRGGAGSLLVQTQYSGVDGEGVTNANGGIGGTASLCTQCNATTCVAQNGFPNGGRGDDASSLGNNGLDGAPGTGAGTINLVSQQWEPGSGTSGGNGGPGLPGGGGGGGGVFRPGNV